MADSDILTLILGPTGAVVLLLIISVSYVRNNWYTPKQVKEIKDEYEKRLDERKEELDKREAVWMAEVSWWRDKAFRALEVAEKTESVSNG